MEERARIFHAIRLLDIEYIQLTFILLMFK